MLERLGSLLVGYLFGNFLTAEIVVQKKTGKRARAIGSGNPGMANVSANLGIKSGLLVLAGDMLKTILAVFISQWLFKGIGDLAVFYTGLGTVTGHNYPVWNRFKGGKGVAVTCMYIVLASPFWGVLSCGVGLVLVLVSRFLPFGGVVIPAVFSIPAFIFFGAEAGLTILAAVLLSVLRFYSDLKTRFEKKITGIHGR